MPFLKILKTKTFWVAVLGGTGIILNETAQYMPTWLAVSLETISIIAVRFLTTKPVLDK